MKGGQALLKFIETFLTLMDPLIFDISLGKIDQRNCCPYKVFNSVTIPTNITKHTLNFPHIY